MKFRHPRGVRLALLSGHTTEVGPAWEELDPIFHQAALEKGCHCDSDVIGDRPATRTATDSAGPAGAPGTSQALDEPALIRKAIIAMIGREQEGDWTGDKNPNTNAVGKLAGFKASKQAVLEVWKAIQAEASDDPGANAGT